MNEVKIITISTDELKTFLRMTIAEEFEKHLLGLTLATNNIAHEGQELIGTEEACRILGCSPRTMQRYRDRKCFSVIKRGPHKALYFRHEIETFRDSNRIEAR